MANGDDGGDNDDGGGSGSRFRRGFLDDPEALAVPGTTTRFGGLPDAYINQLLDLITQQQFPARFGGFLDVLNSFTRRANASPVALQGITNPRLQEMAQAILQATRATSQQLGPFGGRQLGAQMGLARATQPFLSTFVEHTLGAGRRVAQQVGGTSLILPTGRTSTGTREGASDPFGQTAETTRLLAGLFQQFYPKSTPPPTGFGGCY